MLGFLMADHPAPFGEGPGYTEKEMRMTRFIPTTRGSPEPFAMSSVTFATAAAQMLEATAGAKTQLIAI